MTRMIMTFILLCSILLNVTSVTNAGGPPPVGIDPLVPGRAMIRLNGGTIDGFLTILNTDYPALSAVTIDSMASRGMHLIQFTPPPGAVLDELENALNITYVAAGHLLWGELVYEGQAPEGKSGSTWVDSIGLEITYQSQYLISRIGLAGAHIKSTGRGVLVAVLDTGLDGNHPALQGRIATGGFNFITNASGTMDIGNGADDDGDGITDEMTGHGTFVAGLIALVAPESQLLPVTVLNSDGVGNGWTVLKGMYFAIDRGVEVINMSLSSTYESHAMEEALHEARNLGISVVAAAGNFNRNNVPEYPAMTKVEDEEFIVFGVCGTDDEDRKTAFSNYSDVPNRHEVFISAPGASVQVGGKPDHARSIVSALPGGEFAAWEGTSMATPLVAGTIALIRAQHPEWSATSQSCQTIADRLSQGAVNHYAVNPDFANPPQLGVGRLNADAGVAMGPPMPRVGDLNNDGTVGVPDLLHIILNWTRVHTSADINNDGTVSVGDLFIIINNWG